MADSDHFLLFPKINLADYFNLFVDCYQCQIGTQKCILILYARLSFAKVFFETVAFRVRRQISLLILSEFKGSKSFLLIEVR